jgi:hypothetical protein
VRKRPHDVLFESAQDTVDLPPEPPRGAAAEARPETASLAADEAVASGSKEAAQQPPEAAAQQPPPAKRRARTLSVEQPELAKNGAEPVVDDARFYNRGSLGTALEANGAPSRAEKIKDRLFKANASMKLIMDYAAEFRFKGALSLPDVFDEYGFRKATRAVAFMNYCPSAHLCTGLTDLNNRCVQLVFRLMTPNTVVIDKLGLKVSAKSANGKPRTQDDVYADFKRQIQENEGDVEHFENLHHEYIVAHLLYSAEVLGGEVSAVTFGQATKSFAKAIAVSVGSSLVIVGGVAHPQAYLNIDENFREKVASRKPTFMSQTDPDAT